MPLLLCPNCNTSMQNVAPLRRGDRHVPQLPRRLAGSRRAGEAARGRREEQAGQQQDRQRFEREVADFHRDPDDWKRAPPLRRPSSSRHRYDDDDYRYRKKKKGFDIFDIFD